MVVLASLCPVPNLDQVHVLGVWFDERRPPVLFEKVHARGCPQHLPLHRKTQPAGECSEGPVRMEALC